MPPRCRSFRLFAKRPSNPRDGIGETRAQRDLSTRPVNIDALLATRTIVDVEVGIPTAAFRTIAN